MYSTLRPPYIILWIGGKYSYKNIFFYRKTQDLYTEFLCKDRRLPSKLLDLSHSSTYDRLRCPLPQSQTSYPKDIIKLSISLIDLEKNVFMDLANVVKDRDPVIERRRESNQVIFGKQ